MKGSESSYPSPEKSGHTRASGKAGAIHIDIVRRVFVEKCWYSPG